ncbi:hypothetical protein NL676_018883 [Syzygium grande]|nr:hypothetical protein NL676_018883 [Syzygium grande]
MFRVLWWDLAMDLPLLQPLLRDLRSRRSLSLEIIVPDLLDSGKVLATGACTALMEAWVFGFADIVEEVDLRVASEASTLTAFTCLPVTSESTSCGSRPTIEKRDFPPWVFRPWFSLQRIHYVSQ